MVENSRGRIITFYSFKGGTGRSMALANIATTIAQRNGGNKVLVIDWDLEAPGLHRYFRPYLKIYGPEERDKEIDKLPGLIELLESARARAELLESRLDRHKLHLAIFAGESIEEYLIPTDLPQLSLLKAGRNDPSYSSRINTLDWAGLFEMQPEFFGAFADFLASRFTHVLIDSRTGYTDISGICTSLMPDTLVAVFTPNRQSLEGALDVVERAVSYRANSDDLRPLRTFPLASRVELSELKLNDAWRFGDDSEDIQGFQPQFERLFEKIYGIESCNLTAYFDDAQVPYVPYYAFGEKVAVRSEESATVRMSRSFHLLTERVLSMASSWDLVNRQFNLIAPSGSEHSPPVPWDAVWFEGHRKRAIEALSREGRKSFMEVRLSLSRVKPTVSRQRLLEAARTAQIPRSGLPMGFVRDNDDARPRPDGDGVMAQMSDLYGFDYWALRENGDFFSLHSLESEAEVVAYDTRIWEITEVLVYAARLYTRLGITPRAEVRVYIRHSGLKGLHLSKSSNPDRYLEGSSTVDVVEREIEVVLGRVNSDLVHLVKGFGDHVFEVFDFAKFGEETYKKIVSEFDGL